MFCKVLNIEIYRKAPKMKKKKTDVESYNLITGLIYKEFTNRTEGQN